MDVMVCDYNGWNDAPEDEREWFDQHPEIWEGLYRPAEARPFKAPRKAPNRRPRAL